MAEQVRLTVHHRDGTTETSRFAPFVGGDPEGAEADHGARAEAFGALPRPFWDDTAADRWYGWIARPRVRAALLGVAALVLGGAWFIWNGESGGGTLAPATASSALPSTAPTTVGSSSRDDGRVTVHVAGAVQRPGVVTLAAGTRVIDALERVGGATTDADLTRINLAAPLRDGAQVRIARADEPGGSALVVPGDAGAGETGDGLVDLNRATAKELDALPGIGPSRAEQIVRERDAHGPYRSVDDLQRVKGLGAARIAELRDRVRV